MSIVPKTQDELKRMRKAGQILRKTQELLKTHIREGVSLLELDKIAEGFIRSEGGLPAFKGYQGYPATLCTMINSEIVHAIPDKRAVKNGDLLSIDGGVLWEGYHADAAFSVIVGGDHTHPERAMFSDTVKKALLAGCAQAKPGNHVGDIGHAVQQIVEDGGYSLCREFTGHGIGKDLWEDPHVFNYGEPGEGEELLEGMTIAIEPIVASGNPKNKTLKDGWTVVTADGRDACQWEHFGVVTKNGLDIFA